MPSSISANGSPFVASLIEGAVAGATKDPFGGKAAAALVMLGAVGRPGFDDALEDIGEKSACIDVGVVAVVVVVAGVRGIEGITTAAATTGDGLTFVACIDA